MISMTKNEIFESISNISKIVESTVYNPDESIKKIIFQNYFFTDDFGKKVKFDFNIYAMMIDVRILSFLEDSFLDKIDNNELDLGSIRDRIFINSSDANRFSNKQIIKYIRNAVSHSDNSKELFKISPNGRFLEIDLKNTKPLPFHVKIDYRDLEKIVSILSKKSAGKYVTYLDRKKGIIHRVYLKNFPNVSDVYDSYTINPDYVYDYDEAYEKYINYLDINKIEYEVKKYNLTDKQRKLIDKFQEVADTYDKKDKTYSEILFLVFINLIIPLGQEKINYLKNHLDIINCLFRYNECSFNQICDEINKGLFSEDSSTNELSELANHFSKKSILEIYEVKFAMRDYLLTTETITQLLTFYFSCMCDDEYINIDGDIFLKENLRDSLIHGRWYNDTQKNIVCYDTLNGKNNDYNFYWEKTIPLKKILNLSLQKNNDKKTK